MTFFCNNITYMLQLILGKEDTNEITEIYLSQHCYQFQLSVQEYLQMFASSYAVTKHTYTLKSTRKSKRKKLLVLLTMEKPLKQSSWI